MKKKINEVLKEALMEAKPPRKEIEDIESRLKDFLKKLDHNFKTLKINVETFVGGSFAKKTLIKREKYDVDIFVRFDKKYSGQNISELTRKALKKIKSIKIERVHGSRDYFKINVEPWIYFELVPVIKISKPQEAENITDLSFFHVRYINKKLKGKLSDDVILAKSFCHANRVYGAESHIKGFSGYSLELLIQHYNGFLRFIREIAKSKDDKIFIDTEKYYSNKRQILMDMNSSKLESPIILVDPTYKQRNALATLSYWTFKKFKEICKEFLENPDIKFFKLREIDFRDVEKKAKSKGYDFLLLKISTEMQKGAIAGSKLLKFYDHLENSINKYFEIKEKEFYYKDKQDADCFFIAKIREELLIRGPPLIKTEEVKKFKEKHKKTFVKFKVIYAEEKLKSNLKEFIAKWIDKNKEIIKNMYITDIKIID
jgi:tRNA nucleotidyltransferase (CCA-adding enzyme)